MSIELSEYQKIYIRFLDNEGSLSPEITNDEILLNNHQKEILLRNETKINKFVEFGVELGNGEINSERYYIKGKHYVGVQIYDRFQIIVNPKINGAQILQMLNYAYEIEIPHIEDEIRLLENENDIQALFLYWFLFESQNFVKKTFARNYILRREKLNSRIKGKILIQDYIKFSLPKFSNQIIPCQYFEFTANCLENQIIRYTLEVIKRAIYHIENISIQEKLFSLINSVLPYFSFVELKRIKLSDFQKIKYVGRFKGYKKIHDLCKLLLRSYQIDLQKKELEFKSFKFDMNELFERFVIGVLKSSTFFSNTEYQSSFKFDIDGKVQQMKLDGFVSDERKVVFDAKYKELFEVDNSTEDVAFRDGDLIVRNSDIYQMVGYLNSEEIKGKLAFLIYPQSLDKVYPVNGFNKKIFIVGIDCNNINKERFIDTISTITRES